MRLRHRARNYRFLCGDPVARAWVAYVGIGAIGTGLLSIPSYGPPAGLIPLFLASSVLLAVGVIWTSWRVSVLGLSVVSVTCWARALAVFGLGQHGAGSSILASFVWIWISAGALMLASAIIVRRLG